jgi:hypothetical protein
MEHPPHREAHLPWVVQNDLDLDNAPKVLARAML